MVGSLLTKKLTKMHLKLRLLLGKMLHKENSCPRAGFNGRYKVVQEEERKKGKGFRPGMTFYRTGSIRGCCIHWGP
jgi:hypothetical protein